MRRALWARETRNPPLSLPLALCGRRGQPVSGSIPLLGGQPVLNVECFDSAQLGTRQKTIRRHVLSCQLSEITRRRQVPRAAALQQSGPAVLVGLGPRGLGQPDQTLSCARRLLCGKGSQIPDCSRHRPSICGSNVDSEVQPGLRSLPGMRTYCRPTGLRFLCCVPNASPRLLRAEGECVAQCSGFLISSFFPNRPVGSKRQLSTRPGAPSWGTPFLGGGPTGWGQLSVPG